MAAGFSLNEKVMQMKVIRSGPATSIQDMGRAGYGKYGVPESGVMDTYAARLANLLVGNEAAAAVLEITLTGPELYFAHPGRIAVCGLGAEAFLNGRPLGLNEAVGAAEGAVLKIGKVTRGNFLYLAISGGFQSEKILSSRSMYEGITKAARLKGGETLPVLPQLTQEQEPGFAAVRFEMQRYTESDLPVFPGPEWMILSKKEKGHLLGQRFTISPDSNRMAFSLKERIKHQSPSILTVPVLPGTVQLTSGGQLIVLMRDAQVTGGYPRILQMDKTWLDVLAQKRAGEQISFHME